MKMADIVLSAAVRQNLLSLQSTAQLLSTTQGRLATGNKVNSALDNPTNFFTAQGLNNRASDINNLLDSANKLEVTTTNDALSSTVTPTFTNTGGGTATFPTGTTPTQDTASQAIRASLVSQFNNVITQINTTAADSSFNGINLLNGDGLK